MRAIAARARYLALIAVGGLTGLAAITFGWASAKGLRFAHTLITADDDQDLLVVDLLVVIDTYLLAIVQVMVVVGLYELFIGDLDVPRWLEARSLTDLKRTIVDFLIVFIAIKGIERILAATEPLDTLTIAGAFSIIILVLHWCRPHAPISDEDPDPTPPSEARTSLRQDEPMESRNKSRP